MKLYAVAIGMLGYTRTNSVICYNGKTREFEDLTPAEARRMIDNGMIKGLKWKNGENGTEFYCDTKGWNQQNIPVKSANKFRPLENDLPGLPINSMYTVVRVLDTDYRGRLFEVVSNKCCRIKLEEKDLIELSRITNIAGVWITDDEIKIADDVMYENRKADAAFTRGMFKDGLPIQVLKEEKKQQPEQKAEETKEEPVEQQEPKKEPETLEELFGSAGMETESEKMEPVFEDKQEEPEEKSVKRKRTSSKKK